MSDPFYITSSICDSFYRDVPSHSAEGFRAASTASALLSEFIPQSPSTTMRPSPDRLLVPLSYPLRIRLGQRPLAPRQRPDSAKRPYLDLGARRVDCATLSVQHETGGL